MMAALTAAERGLQVLLIDKMNQPGLKLRITGKGRCNLTNTATIAETLPHIGSDSRFIRNAYGAFFNRDLMQFFESRGVPLTEERGGRVFPTSGKAQDIFMALITNIEKHPNVDIRKEMQVSHIAIQEGTLRGVTLSNGTLLQAPQVILTTGGQSYPRTGSTGDSYALLQEAGHSIVPCVPSLVPLTCMEEIPHALVDFALRNVALSITEASGKKICDYFGEMSFCHDGLCGPIVLSASRIITRRLHPAPGMPLAEPLIAHIDLKPALSQDTLDKRLISDLNANGTRLLGDAMRLWLPAELIEPALQRLRLPKFTQLNQVNGDMRRKILHLLKDFTFTITGTHGFDEAIVTQGGVCLKEVNPKTLESRIVPHLYLAGELLDLDADTGGYNLQIAFSTGHAAGMAVAAVEVPEE